MSATLRNGLIALGVVAAAICGLFWVNRERLVLDWLAGKIEARPLAELEAFLKPSMIVTAPPGEGPFPAVLQFHGCSGFRPAFMEQWARVANANGYLAVIVDSHGPRGLDRATALETVCKGKTLLGQERAGDVYAALDIVRARPDVDPARIVLAGWSHGAWSIMDLLALSAAGRPLSSLAERDLVLPPLAGIVLFYPHCGPGARTRLHDWTGPPPALAFVAGADTVVDGPACQTLFEGMNRRAAGVDLVVYPEADHVFDDTSLPAEFRKYYNADAHADAEARYAAFLRARK